VTDQETCQEAAEALARRVRAAEERDNSPRDTWDGWMTGGLGGEIGDLGAMLLRTVDHVHALLAEAALHDGTISPHLVAVARAVLGETTEATDR
jgi:hypothetical protein